GDNQVMDRVLIKRRISRGVYLLLAALAFTSLGRTGSTMGLAQKAAGPSQVRLASDAGVPGMKSLAAGCAGIIDNILSTGRLTNRRFYFLSELQPFIGAN